MSGSIGSGSSTGTCFASVVLPAMHEGELGEKSREIWTNENKEDILKAFGELKEALKSPTEIKN